MVKQLITATLFALGGAGVGLVGYLSVNPQAFTHAIGEPPSVAAERSPILISVDRQPETHPITLAEVRIAGTPRRARKQLVVPPRLDPCSQWRDVGALFVDPAGASGVRNVRALCVQADNER